VQDVAPLGERLVGRKDDGLVAQVASVDDVVEDVGCAVSEGKISDFIDDKNGRRDEALDGVLHASVLCGAAEFLDELCGGDKEGVEAVEDRFVSDGDGEMGLTPAGLALEDEAGAGGDELWSEEAAEQDLSQGGLEREVEFLDGLEEWEACLADTALDAGLGPVCDLLADHDGEEVAVGPLLTLSAGDDVVPIAACVGQVEALEQGVEGGVVDAQHGAPPWRPVAAMTS
jgi:hypothetical protein